MDSETIADILNGRNWVDLHGDESSWCEVDELHTYCCVRPESILHTDLHGMMLSIKGHTHEVCMVHPLCVGDGENWLLVYTHPVEPDIDPMTEEDWDDLYRDT